MIYMSSDQFEQVHTRRNRAGLYTVSVGNRTFTVEQIRTDTPGYGVENRWWISEADDLGSVCFDPEPTKAKAIAAIVTFIQTA